MARYSKHDNSRQGNRAATLKGQLAADGVDRDSVTFSLHPEGAPKHGIVIMNPDGGYTYVPDEGYRGADEFTYDIVDDRGGVTTATKSLNVDESG